MPSYTKQSGDVGTTPSAAKFWREETRLWYVKFVRALVGDPITVTVHASEADADGDANIVATGSQAVNGTEHTVTLTNSGTAPTFTSATVDVTLTASTTVGTSVWEVDLGVRLERCIARILRGFKVYVDGTNSYAHTLASVEMGPKQWEDVDTAEGSDFPYVGVGRASAQITGQELGSYPGPTRYELNLQCIAHNKITGDTVDSNGLSLFHDLRRSIVDLNDETYTGDGQVFSVASVRLADFDRPVEWARDRVSIEFDVTVSLQETREEMAAG